MTSTSKTLISFIFFFSTALVFVKSDFYFEFDQDCSFELPSGKCIQCFHNVWQSIADAPCTEPDIQSKLPEPVVVEKVTAVNSSGTFDFILTLSVSFAHLRRLDIRIAWMRNISGKSYGYGQHQSTLIFFSPWTPEDIPEYVRFNVTFYGVFPFGIFDFQGVSRPSCYGSGLSSDWLSFSYQELEKIIQNHSHFESRQFLQQNQKTNCAYSGPIDVNVMQKSGMNNEDRTFKYLCFLFLVLLSILFILLFTSVIFLLWRWFNKFDWSVEYRTRQREPTPADKDGAIITGSSWIIL